MGCHFAFLTPSSIC